MSSLFLLSLVTLSYFSQQVANAEDCSALSSFVGVTAPSSLETTFLSAEALFPPYSYSLSSTETVILSDNENNGCVDSSNGITTDVNNKIVMVRYNNGNCSEHYKVSILEGAGAIGVLVALDDLGNYVKTIIDDDNVETTTIPTRMITQEDGDLIIEYLNDGSNDGTLEIEFGCLNESYPSVICIFDKSGENWWIDGDYQQEGNDILTWNSHPVFIKEGYYGLINERYIFLDNLDGDEDWRWTIGPYYNESQIPDGYNEYDYIDAVCANTSISSPELCEIWLTFNFSYIYDDMLSIDHFYINEYMNISDGLCPLAEDYICIESDQDVGGVAGTFVLITETTGVWSREFNYKDMAPAFLVYTVMYSYYDYDNCESETFDDNCYEDVYGFILYDSVDRFYSYGYAAYCFIGDQNEINSNYPNDIEFKPWLCEDWYVTDDNTIDDTYYSIDSSFIISDETCQDYDGSGGVDTSDVDDVNDNMCLTDHELLHSFLMGNYQIMDGTTSSGRHIWYLPKNEDSKYTAYLYYHGDFDEDEPWWVIGKNDPTGFNQDNYYYETYAYCAADVNDPRDCDGCWNFFFGDYDADCEVELAEGECEATTTLELITDKSEIDEYYPEIICADYDSGIWYYYAGTYKRSETTIDGRYYYYLIKDAFGDKIQDESDVRYIVYDNFFQLWSWGTTYDILDISNATYFSLDKKAYNPTQCESWYWGDYEYTWWVIEEGECDYPGSGNNKSSNDSTGETVAWVVVIVVLIVCIIIGVLYYRQLQQKNAGNNAVSFRDPKPNVNNNNNNNNNNISDNINNNGTTTGGYNMETLNNDEDGGTAGGTAGGQEEALPEYNNETQGAL